jgi:hypothetical protein
MSDRTKKTKSLNVRISDKFETRLAALEIRSGQKRSEIIRFGLLATWPTIEALVLAHAPESPLADEAGDLAEVLALVRTAQARGLDLKATLAVALNAKLEAEAA